MVKAAYDAGINYFDTAPGYGESENLFGRAFKEMKKTRGEKPFYVSTKSMKADPASIRKDLETSLTRMGLDYVDFFHMWCVLSFDAYEKRKAAGVLAEIERLKEEGLIRHICLSTHVTGADIARMLDDYSFESVLFGYSAMNFAYRELGMEAASRLGRGVVVMNPLGGGIIPRHPERFEFVRTGDDETVVQGALRFLLNDPRITVVLVGFGKMEHLVEALAAADGFRPISSATVGTIRDNLNESYNRMCTGCAYCDDCSQGVPIPKLMDAYNHYILSGDTKVMLNRLAWHWGIGTDAECLRACTECGLCEQVCTQKLPIMESLKTIAAVADGVAQG